MNNQNSNETLNSGIRIVNKISLSVPPKNKFLNIIPLILIAFSGIYGTVFSFFSMFEIKENTGNIIYYIMLFFAFFIVFFMLPKKLKLTIIPILFIYFTLLYKKWSEFSSGLKLLYNQAYSYIYPHSGDYYYVKNKSADNIEIFLIFVIFILTLLICYTVYMQPSFIFGFLCTFPVLETGIYFGKSPSGLPAFMLLIFWVSLLTLSCCGYFQKFGKGTTGFIRKNNTFIVKPGIRFNIAGPCVIIITIITTIIFLVSLLITGTSEYQRSDKINNLRNNLKIAAEDFSFDNLGESLRNFSASLGFDRFKSYSHRLGTVDSINFKESTELTVETDKSLDYNIYLKGYTGTSYLGDRWDNFDEDVYSRKKTMFEEFYNQKCFPQDMLNNYMLQRYNTDFAEMKISSHYKNEKYNYIPYVSVPQGQISYINDTQTELENKQTYTVNVNNLQVTPQNFSDILSGLNYNINDSFDEYTEFVYDNYCSYPDTEGLQEIYDKLVKDTILDTDSYSDNVYQKLFYICDLLAENAEYALDPGITPGTDDFVNYFLLKNHKGYCVHFATAGVILARMSGIPARYAEGYVLLADDFNDQNLKNGKYSVDIKDNRGHAWAEIYIEHLGWIPFEFTPSSAAAFNPPSSETHTETRPAETTKSKKTTTESTHTIVSHLKTSNHNSNSVTNNTTNSITTSNTKKISQPMTLKLKITLLFAFIFITIMAIIIIRHILTLQKRKNIFNSTDNKAKITYAYNYSVNMLSFYGIENINMQYLEFAGYVESQLTDITDNAFTILTKNMLKVQMSNITAGSDEAIQAVQFCKTLNLLIYGKSNIYKKIIMKYIKNL